MAWWELGLFLLVCIILGTGISIFLIKLVSLFLPKLQTAAAGVSVLPFPSPKLEPLPSAGRRLWSLTPELLAEMEHNLRLASETWTGELVSFDTDVWYAVRYEVYDIPTFLRNELEQVYDMLHLANQVVWLSREFGRRSQDIFETYIRMRTSIAKRLYGIKQNIEYDSLVK